MFNISFECKSEQGKKLPPSQLRAIGNLRIKTITFLVAVCAIIVTFVACSFSLPKKGKGVVEVGVAEGGATSFVSAKQSKL